MLFETRSTYLTKAMATNSQATEYAVIAPATTEPTSDGCIAVTSGGIISPNRIMIFPYADAAPGSQFTFRLHYWNHVGQDPASYVWVPMLLVEVLCALADVAGPPDTNNPLARLILSSERFCDNLVAVRGSYGVGGDVVNGSVTPSAIMIELKGARRLQFDFQQIDPNVAMNALWAFA